MSLCQYHESLPIPRVFANTTSPCPYHESLSNPWVHVYTMSPCMYHKSDSIQRVHVNTMNLCQIMVLFLYYEKYSFQIFRNKNSKNKEILISELQKYNYASTTCMACITKHLQKRDFIFFHSKFKILIFQTAPNFDCVGVIPTNTFEYFKAFGRLVGHNIQEHLAS